MKLRERFARFMMGRNGADDLGKALFAVYFVLLLAGLSFRPLVWVAYALLIWILFRLFSKNIYKRRQENLKYLKIKGRIAGFGSLQRRKWRERKTHRYRKCPHCKAIVRLPFKKGKHTVCCPKCRQDFEVNI